MRVSRSPIQLLLLIVTAVVLSVGVATQPPAWALASDITPSQTEPQGVALPPHTASGDVSSLLTPAVQGLRTIAIDPGHGGDDEGVRGADLKEKDLALTIARRVKAAIEGRPGMRVVLTRDDDVTTPIEQRTAIANNVKAELLISLHANASVRPSQSGVVIYHATSARSSTPRPDGPARPERLALLGGGVRDVEFVPWALAQTRYVERSIALAALIEEQLRDRVPVAPHAVEGAPLSLLSSASMPAVLVELGFLTNREDERRLGDTDTQGSIVQAIADAVAAFGDQAGDAR